MQRSSSVGSVTMAAVTGAWQTTSAVPRLAYSSSATAARTRSPVSGTLPSTSALTEARQAARLPFMSYAPRPRIVPFRTTGVRGSGIPSMPTVSRWALSMSERPPPAPRSLPITLGRPGCDSRVVTSSPSRRSAPATYVAMAPSPGAPGTSEGLIELIRINSASVSTRYGRSIAGTGMTPPRALRQRALGRIAIARGRPPDRVPRRPP